MPKEYTHWYLAELCRNALPDLSSGRFGNLAHLLERNCNAYLIGAVAPDLLFYAKNAAQFRNEADLIHGLRGEDTFEPVRAMLRAEAVKGLNEPVIALACGILTHIATDATFHPLVYYFAADSIARHWSFETCMDLHVQTLRALPNEGLFSRLVEAPGTDLGLLSRALCRYFFGSADEHPGAVHAALLREARVQKLFYSRLAASILAAGTVLLPGLRNLLGLSYAGMRGQSLSSFAAPIEYKHPVTCEEQHTSFEELASEAIRRAADMVTALWRSIDSPDPAAGLSGMRGPSLETGLTAGAGTEPWAQTPQPWAQTPQPWAQTLRCARPDLFKKFLPG